MPLFRFVATHTSYSSTKSLNLSVEPGKLLGDLTIVRPTIAPFSTKGRCRCTRASHPASCHRRANATLLPVVGRRDRARGVARWESRRGSGPPLWRTSTTGASTTLGREVVPQAGMHDGSKMPNARPKCASIGLTARYRRGTRLSASRLASRWRRSQYSAVIRDDAPLTPVAIARP